MAPKGQAQAGARDGSSGELLAFRAMTFRTSEHLASRSSEDARSAVTAVVLPKSVEMGGRGLALRQVCLHLCRFGFMVSHRSTRLALVQQPGSTRSPTVDFS